MKSDEQERLRDAVIAELRAKLAGRRATLVGLRQHCSFLEADLVETRKEVERLREALERASEAMNHFGDVLNDMHCVDAVEKQTGVPNDRIDEAFQIVRAALAKETPDA